MELPLWLAEDLSAAGDVAIELPVGYGIKSREELRATARTVRLRDRSPAFYTNGLKLSKLCVSEEAQKLSEDVHHVMADRVKYVDSHAVACIASLTSVCLQPRVILRSRPLDRGLVSLH